MLGRTVRVPVLNDAHAALMGEIWQGAAKDKRDVVMLTLGTGVGGAVDYRGGKRCGCGREAVNFGRVAFDSSDEPAAPLGARMTDFAGHAVGTKYVDVSTKLL